MTDGLKLRIPFFVVLLLSLIVGIVAFPIMLVITLWFFIMGHFKKALTLWVVCPTLVWNLRGFSVEVESAHGKDVTIQII